MPVSEPNIEPVAKAMAEWSSDIRWDDRHPNNQAHWRRVALAVMTSSKDEAAPIIQKAQTLREIETLNQRAQDASHALARAEYALRQAGDPEAAHDAHMAAHHVLGEECP